MRGNGKRQRPTGIDVLGDAPWGTHLCQFYSTVDDLKDILVPYFKAGLENNEFCMWVTSDPLTVWDAEAALREAVPAFDSHLARGQISIIPHSDWYLRGGSFDLRRTLNGWVDMLSAALDAGYEGMRVTGNTAWLEPWQWDDFAEYEAAIDGVLGRYRMLAI